MRDLFQQQARADIIARLGRLTSDAQPKWGSLSAGKLLAHFCDSFAVTFNEKKGEFKPSFVSTALGRWLVISSPFPWPKGVQVPPVMFESDPGDFEADRQQVVAYVERFAAGPQQDWGVSPAFGPLKPTGWARLNWRHLDHHLRQFAC